MRDIELTGQGDFLSGKAAVEADGVAAVRVEDGLAQGAGAAVAVVHDGQGAGRDAVLQLLQARQKSPFCEWAGRALFP